MGRRSQRKLMGKKELNSNNKTAYSMDEPFLMFQMEQSLNDDSINHYYHQFSIDMDGNLVLSADQGPGVEIDKDAPVIEMQVNDHTLKQIKKLIEAHFWELEDFNYNPHFENQMDSITIHLTEDTITVKNNDRDEDHFITIRHELINLLDEEVRKEWEKEIKGYIREINANH